MNARTIDYPCAIADFTDEGAEAALQWALEHKGDGEELTLWAMAQGTLQANDFLRGLSRYKGLFAFEGVGVVGGVGRVVGG